MTPLLLPTGCGATVLRARGRRLSKQVQGDGATVGYDSARTFDLHPVALRDLHELHELLRSLGGRADCALVRGAVADPARTCGVRRLLHDDAETGEAATLREVPRRWVALDVDGVPLPAAPIRATWAPVPAPCWRVCLRPSTGLLRWCRRLPATVSSRVHGCASGSGSRAPPPAPN